MASLKISRKEFEKYIKLTKEVEEKINMMGIPLEEVTNEEINLEVLPNRADCLSTQGFIRALRAFLGKGTGLKTYKVKSPDKDFKVIVDPSVDDVRPYTTCAIIKGLKLDDEKIKQIIDMQEKLHVTLGRSRKKLAIGIYPLEKITLPITYKAMEPDKIKFIPLEMEKEMDGLQILQRHPAGRDYAHLLAGKSRFPVFEDAKNKILSMPPIINSQETGKVTEKTRDVFVECSGFDLNMLKKCLNIITTTLSEMGGTIYQMEVAYKGKKEITPDLTPERMLLSVESANKLLGLELTEKEIKKLLERMGYNFKNFEVQIPAWRTDILHEVDLIEDIAIAYGYDNLIPEIPKIATIGNENPKETIKRKIAEILVGTGLIETSNYHLTTKNDQFTKMGIPEKQESGFIEVENSKTEYNILRKSLTPYALKNLSENIDATYPQRIFEIGRVVRMEKELEEKDRLCIAIAPGNFTELKQILGYLFRMLDIKIELKETDKSREWFINGRDAEILIDNKVMGLMGEIHPKILKNWKIKMPVALLELDLEEIFKRLI